MAEARIVKILRLSRKLTSLKIDYVRVRASGAGVARDDADAARVNARAQAAYSRAIHRSA
jgi:hypothetical protein